MEIHLVWFKRDLRLRDHGPLAAAALRGNVLCAYFWEPEILRGPEFGGAHLRFLRESVAELDAGLRERGNFLIQRRGNLPEALADLHREVPFTHLWSHEETGNLVTYRRDLRVAEWCRENQVAWKELTQNGVIRRLKTRDGWSARWLRRMEREEIEAPVWIAPPSDVRMPVPSPPPESGEFGLFPEKPSAQKGGEQAALAELSSFLTFRGRNYRREMSSPVSAFVGCSRLSPHLAWGTVSLKTVYQESMRRRRLLTGEDGRWANSLDSFLSRLRWRCHFMQKLEDEPEMEFRNLCRACDGLREQEFREDFFGAWKTGETGYPLVDACMKCLLETGWINFRMRAMLVSFASYHLWLHWRRPALFLARHFLDFEPGIHYAQFQMQSGTTGINTLRIYSPAKQALDQDSGGSFIRRWLPALAQTPLAYLSEPHRMPLEIQRACGCVVGRDYPAPVVMHREAVARAKARFTELRARSDLWRDARAVLEKHGSRSGESQRPRPRRSSLPGASAQMEMPLDGE